MLSHKEETQRPIRVEPPEQTASLLPEHGSVLLQLKESMLSRQPGFRGRYPNHVPPSFSFLAADEQQVMLEWYEDVTKHNYRGEAGPPLMSAILGFIMGGGIRRLVQCGHAYGNSALLLGFMMRRMGFKNGLVSIDIGRQYTRYTQRWIDKAQLNDYVKLILSDSVAPGIVEQASSCMGGAPCGVFIDSSHMYEHTCKELDLWYDAMVPGGMMFLHDVSDFAAQWDITGQGGAPRAIDEWMRKRRIDVLRLNRICAMQPSENVYADGCGLGIVQKSHVSIDEMLTYESDVLELRSKKSEFHQIPLRSMSGTGEAKIVGLCVNGNATSITRPVQAKSGEPLQVDLYIRPSDSLQECAVSYTIKYSNKCVSEGNHTCKAELRKGAFYKVRLELPRPDMRAHEKGLCYVSVGLCNTLTNQHICWADNAFTLTAQADSKSNPGSFAILSVEEVV